MATPRRDPFVPLCLCAVLVLLPWLLAAFQVRVLRFEHLHTGETLSVAYWSDGEYDPIGLARIDRLLRDFRTGDAHRIDPRLLDLLHALREKTGSSAAFQVVSGYRTPATNEMLREQGRQVARRSLHMHGQAIDVRLADVPTSTLRDAALALARGGVGYYAHDDFVHLDVGRVRRW
jgi:uncharacterized protein YcbK (DUF882 family)